MNVDTAALAAAIGVLNSVIIIGGGFFFMGQVTTRLKRVEADVSDTRGLVVSAAVDGSRLQRAEADIINLDHDVRNLRRGIGFINDGRAQSVNREY